jgi:hypothetical protein
MTTTKAIRSVLALTMLTAVFPPAAAKAQALSPSEVTAIAADAYLYAYPMLYGYKTMFQQAADPGFPGFAGGFDHFRHYSRGATPADTDIVTPNNDTPYSWAWADLRAEPMVLVEPAIPKDRYVVHQWFDLYTHNFAYVGVRATGYDGGNYLFAGPNWNGQAPPGITKVFRSETDFIGTLTRTSLQGPDDVPTLKALQREYRLMPLSEFAGTKPPQPAPTVEFPAWDEQRANSIEFVSYLNFLLQFCPVVPAERDTMARFAKIGIGPGRPFDSAALSHEMKQALADGLAEGRKRLEDVAIKTTNSADSFGTRDFLGTDYVMKRAVGAYLGIYGNSKEEALYAAYQTDETGKVFDGKQRYVLRFAPGQLPPVNLFWSVTMYNLPQRLLVDNALNRYLINSTSKGLQQGHDGSLEIYVQNERPGADRESNWLPAPAGPFFMILRMYGPREELLSGAYKVPKLVPAGG